MKAREGLPLSVAPTFRSAINLWSKWDSGLPLSLSRSDA